MKKFIMIFLMPLLLLVSNSSIAALNVFACEPEWASLAKEVGGNRVKTYSATTAYQDPHHIEARPSLIAKMRRADLLICSGAELEVGWLPLLQRQAGNKNVLPNARGYFEASAMVERLDIPVKVDRTLGDVHASGNPHIHLDPRRVLIIAKALKARLIELDPEGKEIYQQAFISFDKRWQKAMQRWQQQASVLKGQRMFVNHRDWVYLFDWLGIKIAGELEPKPGLPTTATHLAMLKESFIKNSATKIVYASYQSSRAAKRFSQMINIPAIELPYTVGGAKQATDLFGLFDVTIKKLIGAVK